MVVRRVAPLSKSLSGNIRRDYITFGARDELKQGARMFRGGQAAEPKYFFLARRALAVLRLGRTLRAGHRQSIDRD
jgi:hypothetical protein